MIIKIKEHPAQILNAVYHLNDFNDTIGHKISDINTAAAAIKNSFSLLKKKNLTFNVLDDGFGEIRGVSDKLTNNQAYSLGYTDGHDIAAAANNFVIGNLKAKAIDQYANMLYAITDGYYGYDGNESNNTYDFSKIEFFYSDKRLTEKEIADKFLNHERKMNEIAAELTNNAKTVAEFKDALSNLCQFFDEKVTITKQIVQQNSKNKNKEDAYTFEIEDNNFKGLSSLIDNIKALMANPEISQFHAAWEFHWMDGIIEQADAVLDYHANSQER